MNLRIKKFSAHISLSSISIQLMKRRTIDEFGEKKAGQQTSKEDCPPKRRTVGNPSFIILGILSNYIKNYYIN